MPVAKVHFNSLKKSTKPYVSAVAARITTAYRACKDAIQPCMAKSQEFADHYWQVTVMHGKPFHLIVSMVDPPKSDPEHEGFHPSRNAGSSPSHMSHGWLQRPNLTLRVLNHTSGLPSLFGERSFWWRACTILRCSLQLQSSFSSLNSSVHMSQYSRLIIHILGLKQKITDAMQVQKGISGFLEESELLDPLSAHILAWWTVTKILPSSQNSCLRFV